VAPALRGPNASAATAIAARMTWTISMVIR
jgi:hypothetical protein